MEDIVFFRPTYAGLLILGRQERIQEHVRFVMGIVSIDDDDPDSARGFIRPYIGKDLEELDITDVSFVDDDDEEEEDEQYDDDDCDDEDE